MLKFLQLIFLVGAIVNLSGCSSKDVVIKYEYPKNKQQKDVKRIGSLSSEPIYIVKPK